MKPGDTMIFDRNYYSRAVLDEANIAGVKVLFRLKRDAFRGVRQFFNSCRTTAYVNCIDASVLSSVAYL
eukprot:2705-Heterococcus_DN1.PRE.6